MLRSMTFTSNTRADEIAHLLKLYDHRAEPIMARLEGQLSILATRAQTLLSLAGLTITVTGFSGASIARSGTVAMWLCVSGLITVLISAAMTILGILRVEWTTQMKPCELPEAIDHALALRDAKTRAFSRALVVLVLGLGLYVSSVTMLLWSR
jgi:hypothetical protein